MVICSSIYRFWNFSLFLYYSYCVVCNFTSSRYWNILCWLSIRLCIFTGIKRWSVLRRLGIRLYFNTLSRLDYLFSRWRYQFICLFLFYFLFDFLFFKLSLWVTFFLNQFSDFLKPGFFNNFYLLLIDTFHWFHDHNSIDGIYF